MAEEKRKIAGFIRSAQSSPKERPEKAKKKARIKPLKKMSKPKPKSSMVSYRSAGQTAAKPRPARAKIEILELKPEAKPSSKTEKKEKKKED